MKACRTWWGILWGLALMTAALAGDSVRPGLEPLEKYSYGYGLIENADEQALVRALKEPFLKGLNVQAAMQAWFDGRLQSSQGKEEAATATWKRGLTLLDNLEELPPTAWGPIPDGSFRVRASFTLSEKPDVALDVVEWTVDGLKQYGVLLYPVKRKPEVRYPLILYCHGAAFGLSLGFMPWLADVVRMGYVVIGPAMRGEELFTPKVLIDGKALTCEGEIENLEGEVNDCLSMVKAAWKLPYVRPDEFAMVGHSFGAGVGLLTAARFGAKAKAVVSYDAWLVNPQRYYWDRMNRGANNWLSWADFCNQDVASQLAGLKKRSIILNANMLQCPMLLFMGGAYEGSVFHLSHDDFRKVLDKLGKSYVYDLIPNGVHNTVLYTESEPARYALKKQQAFLKRHFPPLASEEPKAEGNTAPLKVDAQNAAQP